MRSPRYVGKVERKNGEADRWEDQGATTGSVERYMDQFLRFGQNTDIGTHFTEVTHGLAKEVNCSLLEKVRWLVDI